jgi:general secretion pathway protein I
MSLERQRGFTLLEVLIAFVIAALALAVMFDASLTGLRASETASRYEEALSLARSHLAAAGVAMLADREQSGDDGHGFHWTLRIRPLGAVSLPRGPDSDRSQKPQPQATLFGISVIETWQGDGSERQVRLDSARLGTGTARGG